MSEISTRPSPEGATWASAHQRDDTWEVVVGGELDLAASDLLRGHLAGAGPGTCRRVVVDAREVTFLDCGGLRALLAAAEACGGEVWLRSPSPAVLRFAALAGLQQRWPAIGSADEVRLT